MKGFLIFFDNLFKSVKFAVFFNAYNWSCKYLWYDFSSGNSL